MATAFLPASKWDIFKPMLADKKLSMCQDMVPNTAEGKMMMYAIVWNSSGTAMIQIGITPSRLLAKMNSASVENLVRQMPITSGMNIFLLNATTGKMLATTRQDVLLYELQDSDRLGEGKYRKESGIGPVRKSEADSSIWSMKNMGNMILQFPTGFLRRTKI